MGGDPIGDRMKGYEHAARFALPLRMPVIVRVDGKAFHTWTRGCDRPFDDRLIGVMNAAAVALCQEMQGAVLAYAQSDEISILLHNYKRLASSAWFDNEVQKVASVSAAIAAATVTAESPALFGKVTPAYFDARVFVLPEPEVCNYFIWRQQDATRNSIQMAANAHYSQAQMHRINTSGLQDMLHAKGINWNDYPTTYKRGRCVVREVYSAEGGTRSRWVVDNEIPIFTQDRSYVERLLAVEPEAPKPIPRFAEA